MTALKIDWHRLQAAHALPGEATMLCSICAGKGPRSRNGDMRDLEFLQGKRGGFWWCFYSFIVQFMSFSLDLRHLCRLIGGQSNLPGSFFTEALAL